VPTFVQIVVDRAIVRRGSFPALLDVIVGDVKGSTRGNECTLFYRPFVCVVFTGLGLTALMGAVGPLRRPLTIVFSNRNGAVTFHEVEE
jgi:hypothetical protein